MSGINRLCFDGDRPSVNSMQECEKAAEYMKYEFKNERRRDYLPPGCYFFHGTKSIYHNYVTEGRESYNAEQICKGKGK